MAFGAIDTQGQIKRPLNESIQDFRLAMTSIGKRGEVR
jgi:hypothetical protein